MNTKRSSKVAVLLSCVMTSMSLPTLADSETTTVKTVTTSNVRELVLPAARTYLVVDPITGNVKGAFDPSRGLRDAQAVRPGLVVVDQDSGKVIAAIDSEGRTIDVGSIPAFDSLVTGIDTRRAELSLMITDSLSKGNIDTSQCGLLRNELSKIGEQEEMAKQSGGLLTYSEALSLALALSNLGDRISLMARTTGVAPLLAARFVDTNGQLIMLDDTKYRQSQLRQRIDDEYTAGRLSTQQVARLKDELNAVASFESKYTKNGVINSAKKDEALAKLDKIKAQLDEDVANINAKRTKIGLRVD